MSRILVLIEHKENRRLLAEWLSLHHEVALVEAPSSEAFEATFDLGIVDGPSLERHGRWIEATKRSVDPLLLPFLLVTHRQGIGVAASNAWERVDELIISPIEKLELQARVETLLRARALSLANAALSRRLEQELARAREVQAGLLPRKTPRLPGFDLAARCIPAREVGGDFFDWQSTEDTVVLSVGDVMGKGIPAALLAATVRAVLRALARQNPPAAALDLLQETLAGDLECTRSFVTLFHARLTASARELCYVDAGHGHAVVRRANGTLERLSRGGRPIGFPCTAPYRQAALHLSAGDVLFVYSDGLLEGGAQTGEELIEHVDVRGAASAIVQQLTALAPKTATVDDVTVLALKCTHDGAPTE